MAFFQRFQAVLQARQLTVRGITTDGSALYPVAIQVIFGSVPHQICEFHILKDLNQAILRAAAQVRKHLAAQRPSLGRGRPTRVRRAAAAGRQSLGAILRRATYRAEGGPPLQTQGRDEI